MARVQSSRRNTFPLLQGYKFNKVITKTLQGRTYLCKCTKTNNKCVIKEAERKFADLNMARGGQPVVEDIFNEIKILKYLSKQPIVHSGFASLIEDIPNQNDCIYYSMEYCNGSDLFDYIVTKFECNPMCQLVIDCKSIEQKALLKHNQWTKHIASIFINLIDCVSWLHSKGICHLDLSLENVMYDSKTNIVKIIDFGVAKHFSKNKKQHSNFKDNRKVGKSNMMAPEVWNKQVYDARFADIWCLGVMFFMMSVGAPLWDTKLPPSMEYNKVFNLLMFKGIKHVLKCYQRLPLVTEDGLDLMDKIFKFEDNRINMEDILNHKYITLNRKYNKNNEIRNNKNNVNNMIKFNNTANINDTIKLQTHKPQPRPSIPIDPSTLQSILSTYNNNNNNNNNNITHNINDTNNKNKNNKLKIISKKDNNNLNVNKFHTPPITPRNCNQKTIRFQSF